MTVYVVEINGRSIAAFDAGSAVEAQMFTEEEFFRTDLQVLENDGRSLWDGESELYVRDAFPEEAAKWEASRAHALKDGEIEGDDDWLLFLVPVTDPTDDFTDDD